LDERIALAHLRPPTKESTQIYCFVCDKAQKVERVPCSNKDCKSNVLTDEKAGRRTRLLCWTREQ
jgi:hypothetical protein